jgi:threonylcarbamoyladenosine tRNA methylthiotransferase CDKAL1
MADTNAPRRFFLANNGCERRKLEAQKTVDYLTANGYEEAKNPEDGDLIVYLSCAADEKSEVVARKAIVELEAKKSSKAKLVVGGCLPAINPSFLEGIGDIKTLGPQSMGELDTFADNITVPFAKISEPTRISLPIYKGPRMEETWDDVALETGAATESDAARRYDAFKRSSDIIRIAHGCLSACSYCAIRTATGMVVSREMGEIVAQIRELYGKGSKRFTLTSEDTSAYGLDIGTTFVELLARIEQIADDLEVTVQAANPRWLYQQLPALKTLLSGRKFLRHMVVPVQCASDRLLREMNRQHKIAEAEEVFQALLDAGVEVHTHLIVGFPGETKEELEDMIEFMRRHKRIDYYLNSFSDRPGTQAHRRNDKLPEDEVQARYKHVMDARSTMLTA